MISPERRRESAWDWMVVGQLVGDVWRVWRSVSWILKQRISCDLWKRKRDPGVGVPKRREDELGGRKRGRGKLLCDVSVFQ